MVVERIRGQRGEKRVKVRRETKLFAVQRKRKIRRRTGGKEERG